MANTAHRPPDRRVVKTEKEDYPIGRYDSERVIELSSIEEGAVENDARQRYPDEARGQESGSNIDDKPHRIDDSVGLDLRLVVDGRLDATGLLSKLQKKTVRTAEKSAPHRGNRQKPNSPKENARLD